MTAEPSVTPRTSERTPRSGQCMSSGSVLRFESFSRVFAKTQSARHRHVQIRTLTPQTCKRTDLESDLMKLGYVHLNRPSSTRQSTRNSTSTHDTGSQFINFPRWGVNYSSELTFLEHGKHIVNKIPLSRVAERIVKERDKKGPTLGITEQCEESRRRPIALSYGKEQSLRQT